MPQEARIRTAEERRHPPCCAVTHTDAVEDVLKVVFVLTGRGEPVSTSVLAQELGVTAPTVSIMLKRLEEHGLVDRTEAHLARLTGHGEWHAQQMVRKHRLIETFLARVLDVPWDEVHAEAEVLEHAVSDRLVARIDDLLGRPALDPHGDPIPVPGTDHDEAWGQRIDGVSAGTRFRIERVYDRDSAALRYLAELGLTPGVTVEVGRCEPFGGPLWISVGERWTALGPELARLLHGKVLT